LKYIIVDDVPDGNIIQKRMMLNQRTKRSITQTCLEAQYALEFIGSSQGKKRTKIGLENLITDEEFDKAATNRYEIVCVLIGVEMSSSTLRKLMEVFLSEYGLPENEQLGLLKQLNENKVSIDKAHKLLNKKNEKVALKEARDLSKNRSVSANGCYRLYNKSSLSMDEVDDESVTLIVDSHPYWKLRKYRNQGENPHGMENTNEEYVKNFVQGFCREKWKKLKPGGVMVTILGETYKGGYQGICTKVETALEADGWRILDVNIWSKTNGKYAPHPFRFVNSYERIIVACKPGAEPYFQEVMRPSSTEGFKVKKTQSGGLYVATPESCITNVITTATHNPSELRVVRDDFDHDAPCREDIYEKFIEAYSKVGDTILDGFVGSGTVGIALSMGRNVIGYDVDYESIEYCFERFDLQLANTKVENQVLLLAA